MIATNCLFPSSIAMTIPSAQHESRWKELNLKTKIDGLLSDPFTLIILVILQDFPLSMFLHVVTTKVMTYFNDNDKGLKVYRQETKKSKQHTLLVTIIFWVDINCFVKHKPILILWEKSSSSKMYSIWH